MIRLDTPWLRILRIGCGLVLLSYVIVATDGWRIGAQLLSAPRLALILVAWMCVGALVEAKRLALLLTAHDIVLPLRAGVRLVIVAAFFGLFVPGGTGGDVAKLFALASNRPGRRVEVALVLLVDRAVGLFCLLFLVTVLAPLNRSLVGAHALFAWLVAAAGVGLLLMTGGVAVAWSARLRTGSWYGAVARLPGGTYVRRVWEALYAFRAHRAALAAAFAVSLIGHAVMCGAFVLIAAHAIPTARSSEIILLSLLGMLANGLPITPAGLGVGEAAFAALFAAAGYQGGSQLMLAQRIAVLPFALVGGLLFLVGARPGTIAPSTGVGEPMRSSTHSE